MIILGIIIGFGLGYLIFEGSYGNMLVDQYKRKYGLED